MTQMNGAAGITNATQSVNGLRKMWPRTTRMDFCRHFLYDSIREISSSALGHQQLFCAFSKVPGTKCYARSCALHFYSAISVLMS